MSNLDDLINRSQQLANEILKWQSDRSIAEQLALKEYASKRIIDARSEKYALDKYIASLKRQRHAEQFLQAHPGAAELIIPQLRSKDKFVKEWAAADYRKSDLHPEMLLLSHKDHFALPDFSASRASSAR